MLGSDNQLSSEFTLGCRLPPPKDGNQVPCADPPDRSASVDPKGNLQLAKHFYLWDAPNSLQAKWIVCSLRKYTFENKLVCLHPFSPVPS